MPPESALARAPLKPTRRKWELYDLFARNCKSRARLRNGAKRGARAKVTRASEILSLPRSALPFQLVQATDRLVDYCRYHLCR